MQTRTANNSNARPGRRRGTALLLCLFVISLTSVMALTMVEAELGRFSALRNTADFERALYLAGAGAHHALAQLEADFAWRGTVTEGSYPATNTYSATAANGVSGQVVITSIGVSGGATRTVQVTVQAGS